MRVLTTVVTTALVLMTPSLAVRAAGSTPPRPRSQDVQVGVLHDGTTLLNNRPDSLSDIERHFAMAARAHGMVWYFRDAGAATTSAGDRAVDAVIKLVIRYRLPITMSTKPDYSDYVDGRDGQSHPRPSQ